MHGLVDREKKQPLLLPVQAPACKILCVQTPWIVGTLAWYLNSSTQARLLTKYLPRHVKRSALLGFKSILRECSATDGKPRLPVCSFSKRCAQEPGPGWQTQCQWPLTSFHTRQETEPQDFVLVVFWAARTSVRLGEGHALLVLSHHLYVQGSHLKPKMIRFCTEVLELITFGIMGTKTQTHMSPLRLCSRRQAVSDSQAWLQPFYSQCPLRS